MSKYLLIGDIHLSDRPPSSCTDTYLDDLFAILEHTVGLEESLGVAGVIWCGDVFHHKQPSRTSHRTVQRAIELVQSYKKLWIVPGNHDMLNDRFESLAETQPLGVLLQAGAELLKGWESAGEHPIYGIPWQQRWDEETIEAAMEAWHGQTANNLLVTHAPLYPPSLELPYEYYPTKDEEGRRGWSSLMGNHGSCYYGHVHERHGTFEVGGVTYCNQGAITRGSLHESDLKRSVAVTTWSQDEGFVRVEVPHKPADQVFRLMEKRELEDAQESLDGFLLSVGQTRLEITSIEAVIKQIQDMNLGEEITSMVSELLQEAQSGH